MTINFNNPLAKNELRTQEQASSQVRLERDGHMNTITFQKQGRVLVTVLQLFGKLDGSNYMQLLDETRKNYINGVRDLLIDLSQLTFLSSAGIAAIHKTALMFRGLPMAEEESGWATYHAIDRDRGNGVQQHVKLLSPQAEVAKILEISGFGSLFEIHTDLETAIASF
jgi:anti-anti-sigma regulatory factor